MIDTKENSQSIEKETRKNDIVKPYQTLLANDEINKKFNYEELQYLYKGIDTTKILLYGQQALIGLLKDFTKDDIDRNLLIYEMNELEKYQLEKQRNDLRKLKNEIINTNTSEIQTNTSEIQTNTSEIQTNTSEIQTNTSEIQTNTSEIQNKVNNLKSIYQNIDTHFKANLQSNEWTNFIQKKEQDINLMQILNENNIDPNFYFQIQYTAEQLIKESSELTEEQITFVNQFNTLNKTLNIDYQITIPIDKIRNTPKPNNLSDIIQTPNAVFAYPSVREYTNKQTNIVDKSDEKIDINPKLEQDVRTNTPKDKQQELWELIKKNCIDNKFVDIQEFNYSPTVDINQLLKNPKTIHDTTKKQIQTIIDNILGSYTQEHLISQTNAQAKQLIITQAIAGLARYFDTTTSPTNNYASDFDLTKEGNISIEDNSLHISGQMHGQLVHFFYNLQTGELQANDYLYKVIKAESFLINDIDQGRYTLPNALPTITDLQKTMKDIDYVNMMQNSTSLNNYQTTIRKQSDAIKEKFSTQTYNKLYITRTNEKNLFIQETLDGIGGQPRLLKIAGRSITIDNTSNPVEITRSLHPNEYELLLLLDRTSQIYRSPEQLRNMRKSIDRRKQTIQDPRIANGTHNDPVINKLFNQQALLQDTENRNNPSKKSNFLVFFDLVSNPQSQFGGGILDTNLLEKVIHRIENNQPIAMLENPRPLEYANDPRYFNEKYGKILYENL